MNIKDTLENLVHYYNFTRGVGHTNGMMDGVKNTSNSLVMAHNTRFGDEIRKTLPPGIVKSKNISFVSVESDKSLRGRKSPLFIDNAALHMIFRDALCRISYLESENASLNNKITKVQEILG